MKSDETFSRLNISGLILNSLLLLIDELLSFLTSLTSRERLREDFCGEGGLGARAGRAALLVLLMFAEHVPPASVQEAVQDVRGDDVRQRGRRLRLKGRLQAQ